MVRYPITLEPDDDTIMVTFPDFPEAHTFGEDREEALRRAPDALATMIDAYIRDRRPLPAPSPIAADSATLSALMSAKVELYNEMTAEKVSKSELARRLKVHPPQVDRLLDLNHGSKVDQLEAAAKALGRVLDVIVVAGDASGSLTPANVRVWRPARAMGKAQATTHSSPMIHPGVLRAQKPAVSVVRNSGTGRFSEKPSGARKTSATKKK